MLDQHLQTQKYNNQKWLTKVMINVCLTSLVDGYFICYFNTINFNDTIRIFNLAPESMSIYQAVLSFCVTLGAGFGAYHSNKIIDRYSRRQCLYLIGFIAIVSTIMLQTGITAFLVIFRLIQGICLGLYSVIIPIYIKEISPIELNSRYSIFNAIFFSCGVIYSFIQVFVLSFFFQPEVYWRIVYAFPLIPISIQVYNLYFNFCFETPKYYMLNGDYQQAKRLLQRYYKEEYVQQRIQQLEKLIELTKRKSQTEMKVINDQDLNQIQNKHQDNGLNQSKSNKLATIACLFIASLQQFSGIQLMIAYAGDIVLEVFPKLQKLLPAFIHVPGFIGVFFSSTVINMIGRKKTLQLGHLGSAFLLIMEFVCFSFQEQISELRYAIIVCLLLHRALFSFTLGPVVWTYASQVLEPQAVSIVAMTVWLSGAFVIFIFPLLREVFGGQQYCFLLLGIYCIIGYIVCNKILIETMNKAEYETRRQYDNKWREMRKKGCLKALF